METAARSRAWRAIVVLCGLILLGSAAELRAGTLLSPGAGVLVRKSAEPFGVFAFAISTGSLRQKWFALKDKLDDDMVQLALCDGDRDNCASPAALKLLAIVDQARTRDGRARLGETNRAINLAIPCIPLYKINSRYFCHLSFRAPCTILRQIRNKNCDPANRPVK